MSVRENSVGSFGWTPSSPRHVDVPVMWLRTKASGAIAARKGPALAPLVRKTEDQIRALRVVERADADVVLPGSKVAGGAEHDDGDVEQISREVEKAVKNMVVTAAGFTA